jgi:hypothetical protein
MSPQSPIPRLNVNFLLGRAPIIRRGTLLSRPYVIGGLEQYGWRKGPPVFCESSGHADPPEQSHLILGKIFQTPLPSHDNSINRMGAPDTHSLAPQDDLDTVRNSSNVRQDDAFEPRLGLRD